MHPTFLPSLPTIRCVRKRVSLMAIGVLLGALSVSPLAASARQAGSDRKWDAAGGSAEGSPEPLDTLTAYWSWKEQLKEDGFDFVLNYTSEDLVAVRGGSSDALVHAGQASFTGQADLERLGGWNGAAVTLSISHRDGQGINARSGIGALLGPQEIFGRGNVARISQLWIDQKFMNDRLSLRFGRGNPGSDFEEFDCNFVNLSYCGNQVGNIVSDYWYNYPISQWGAIAKVKTGQKTYLKAGIYQVNPRNLKNGFLDVLSPSGGTGALVPVELGWSPRLGAAGQASMKFGGWYSTAARDDVYLDNNRGSAAQSGMPHLKKRGSYGGYASIVARFPTDTGDSSRNVTAFFNATLADTATSTVDRSFAVGVVWTGPISRRPQDQIGLAVSANHLNGRLADYRRERLALGSDDGLPGSGENAVELFYGVQVTRFLQVRPDVQWIHRPGGTSANPDAIIVGARTSISL